MTQRAVRATGWVFITALALAPVLVLALGALSSAWFFPDPWPADLTLRHAVDTLQAPATRDAIGAGLTISAIVTVLAVALSWPAAQVLARPHLTGRAVVAAVLLLPSLLPPVGLAIGLDVFLLRAGLAGTPTGVVVAHLVPVLPYVVVSLAAGFARHDRLLEAQAAVLGAAGRQRLLHVTIPAMRRSIIVAAALGFVVSWSQYLLTVLVGSGKVITITTLLFAALAGGNPTTVGVLALVVALPAVGVLVFAGTRTEPASRS
jgi:putative spermidine/putrescine transport system permease protein